MKNQKWIAGPLALACSLGMAGLAGAQPPATPGAGTNPPNQTAGGNLRATWQNMTPEQRQAAIVQFTERRLRNDLTQAGFADAATQDPIVAFSKTMEALRRPLREKATKLREAVANKTADAVVTPLISDLRKATEDAKQPREEALKVLDGKINYSTKPRLQAFLMVGGLLGDEMAFAGGAGGFGAGGFSGGGFGGQGGRGGAGGQGGAGQGAAGAQNGQGGAGGRGRGRGGRGGNNAGNAANN